MKLYGPYLRKDGRKHFLIKDGDNMTSLSYPKWLMEQHLGRKLEPDETVDHKDNDFRNDDISNLQILTRSENTKKEMQRPERAKKYFEFDCPVCGTLSKKPLKDVESNRRKGREGPFCSRSCAGTYSHQI
jgi:hypothetical protein